ncbi:hypothetical protein AB0K92_27785 [Streptomyces sp. NPDC052687]|uniref:hypothetical protein n=1 Tax=Streptomyces sp. NPDC052687 TaxID=3154759 RepID=UPI0034239B93
MLLPVIDRARREGGCSSLSGRPSGPLPPSRALIRSVPVVGQDVVALLVADSESSVLTLTWARVLLSPASGRRDPGNTLESVLVLATVLSRYDIHVTGDPRPASRSPRRPPPA